MCRSRDVCPLILMYSLLDMYVLFCPIFPTRAYNKVDENNKVQKVLPVFDKYLITIPIPRASYGGRFCCVRIPYERIFLHNFDKIFEKNLLQNHWAN